MSNVGKRVSRIEGLNFPEKMDAGSWTAWRISGLNMRLPS